MRELCRDYEARFGYAPTEFVETTAEDAGFSQTQWALNQDISLVIAAGGDGTVRLATAALAGTDVPLAVIPLGTGNLLARGLDLPTATLLNSDAPLHRALEIAFDGAERQIDLVRAEVERPDGTRDSFVFSVMAGIGIDAGMIANTNTELKRKVGWLAYGVGIAQVLAHRWHRGRSNQERMVAYNQGREILLRLDSKPEEFQVDGDTVGKVVAVRFKSMPLALRVRCPHPELEHNPLS